MQASSGTRDAWAGAAPAPEPPPALAPAAQPPLPPPLPSQLQDLVAAACVEPGFALWAAAGCPHLEMFYLPGPAGGRWVAGCWALGAPVASAMPVLSAPTQDSLTAATVAILAATLAGRSSTAAAPQPEPAVQPSLATQQQQQTAAPSENESAEEEEAVEALACLAGAAHRSSPLPAPATASTTAKAAAGTAAAPAAVPTAAPVCPAAAVSCRGSADVSSLCCSEELSEASAAGAASNGWQQSPPAAQRPPGGKRKQPPPPPPLQQQQQQGGAAVAAVVLPHGTKRLRCTVPGVQGSDQEQLPIPAALVPAAALGAAELLDAAVKAEQGMDPATPTAAAAAAAAAASAGGEDEAQAETDAESAAAALLLAAAAPAGPDAPAVLSSETAPRSALRLHTTGTAVESDDAVFVTFHLPPPADPDAAAGAGAPSATTPVSCRFMFQKVLSASDVGKLGRIVLPRCSERYLPQPVDREGLWLDITDPLGTLHSWRLTFWLSGGHGGGAPDAPSQGKRTHLLENCKPFLQAWQLTPKTTLAFYRLPSGGYLADPRPLESHFKDDA